MIRLLPLVLPLFLAAPAIAGESCRAIDGDTIACVGRAEHIRISNIDAPELHGRCPSETAAAARAKDHLSRRLALGEVVIAVDHNRSRDRHGRILAHVTIDDRDIGDELIALGLARPWTGRREPWCF